MRQFILLTPELRYAPLLDAKFSFSREILRDFIIENEAQLFALTAQDAVARELNNSVFQVTDAIDLFYIYQIDIEADTTDETLAQASALGENVDQFMQSDTGCKDDVLIADMISLAKSTGNIVRNPVTLTGLRHPIEHF